ncbi:helix-turn-helix domain-containing protein [Paenibacillus rubinfantis]|uniref:helix-turn-helix domain-containing protein n=1 Tax=Paenibacillus rubinfantis TaxID=1720296 RepID=UPI0009EB7F72|nr:helix-turn-helix domain-containing protein [Paenibacillus rubinfantis]
MEKNQLARRIRAFRKLKGHTQLEFAEQLDISIGILGACVSSNCGQKSEIGEIYASASILAAL